jgi:hypothetical protein
MTLEKFLPRARDTWSWRLAQLDDVDDIVSLAQQFYQKEIAQILTPTPRLFAFNLRRAIVNQTHDLSLEQVIVAVDRDSLEIVAWAWCQRGIYMPYAPEECAEAAFAHVRLDMTARERVRITAQIIQQWILWCQFWHIPVLVSSSIRQDQTAFMRLHKRFGFQTAGSLAYIGINKETL